MGEQPEQSTLRDVQGVPSAGASGLLLRVVFDYVDGEEQPRALVLRGGSSAAGDWIRLGANDLRYLRDAIPFALARMVGGQ